MTDKVGYKSPPKDKQFKKGVSGNPKGRPKKELKRLREIVEGELSEVISVNEGGEMINVNKIEAVIKQLTNKAMAGDKKAIDKILKLYKDVENKNFGIDIYDY